MSKVRYLEQRLKYRKTVKILNIDIDNFSMSEFLHSLKEGVVLTPNVDHLMRLQKDPEFMRIYDLADYKVCDSQILVLASYFLQTPFREKISGSDLFPAFCEFHKDNQDIRIFLLGGVNGAPERAADRINSRFSRDIIVGSYSPPFNFEKDEQECLDIVDRINQSRATVLAIGVGAPKQEKWIYRHKDKLPFVKIFMGIGATINFEAGLISRSPKWVSNFGLEWLHRIACEPRRLWKRYLINDLPFVWLITKQKLNFYKPPILSVSRSYLNQ
jgi:N-acetylglucosaminyldiphosphoundecaprenol N-acetyl-beta-D-mannosaminyltransferase